MKHLKLFFALFAMLALGVGNAWGETVTYQHVFNKKPSTGNSVALSSVNWKIEATALNNYNSNNYAGVQIGSSKAAGSITLTSTTDWDYNGNGKITEVRLWLNTGGSTVTPTVTIGGKSATSDGTQVVKNSKAGTDWTKATKVTFTPVADGNTGVVVINVSTEKAGYICAMEIDCEPATADGDDEGGNVEIVESPTFSETEVNFTEAFDLTIASAAGTTLKYTLDNSDPTTSNTAVVVESNTATVAVSGKSTVVKAVAVKGELVSGVKSITYCYVNSKETAYTITEALEVYNAGLGLDNSLYIQGTVKSITEMNTTQYYNANYTITDGENDLYIFRGKGIDGANFTSESQLLVGDDLVIYGKLSEYQGIPQVAQDSKIISRESKTKAIIAEDLTFDAIAIGAEVEAQTLTVTGANLTAEIAATLDNENFTVTPATLSVDGGELTITPATDLAVGEHTATLTLTSGETTKEVALSILVKNVYTITWSVNGETSTTSVVEGDKLVLPTAPETPEACSEKVFVGWTAAEEVNADGSDIEWVTAATLPTAAATYYAVFAVQEGEGGLSEVVDVLDRALTGVEGTNYASWADVSATSEAVYAGQSAGGNEAIQLRSNNSNSGVISTTSGGKLAKVVVSWNSNTASGRTLNIYGSNTAYASPADLYGDASGEKLGTIVNGTSTELVIEGDYAYVGLRSNSGAMYLDEIQITWLAGAAATYTNYSTTCVAPVVNYTITITAGEGGTVTGLENDGVYAEGTELTLTATPAFDYEFVKWSNESTENPLTITVTDNDTLEAIFAEVAATEKKESGVFSISAHKTATFATGNLQHNVGTGEWRFAKQQYQVVGEQNINLGDPAFTGWIDMLGWSTNDEGNNFGVNPSNVNELYDGEFVDWGTKMGEGWSTLSADDWKYLLNTRANAADLKQVAKVGTMVGILLFPDAWTMPDGCTVEAEKDEYFNVNIYNYTIAQWNEMEAAGAVFLPAAGRRTGGYGNKINYDQVEETNPENLNGEFYRWQDNTNIYCYYWTSTINEDKNVSYLHNVWALGKDEYTIGNAAIWGEKGRYGQSVRLAKVVYDKHTVNATAENGTVTGLVGGGIYEHGATATLTATPAFDYEFVNWTVGEETITENPLTITVTDNVTLEANFAEVAATEKKESGVFSISAHKTATFATGNLQYNVGTQTWRFAKQQYQVVGEQNIQLGHPDFTGWIDMLGWSTNDEGNNFGVNPSNVNELYAGEFVDWGTKMGAEWSTLSADDWKYLLNTRANAADLKQVAKVGTMVGILLFPDAWTMPDGCTVEAEKDEYFNVNIYNYTIAQWNEMEAAGAVFLPAAGRRTGGYGNKINYDQVEETDENNLNGGYYRHQDNTNIYCYYWTSTINAETKNVSYLHNIVALGNDEYTIGTGAVWGEKGRYGQSVRLAKVVYDKHDVTVITENGTVTGAGTYEHGATATLTAAPAEHYVFVNWTKGEEVVAETAEYTFTVEADVELVANFKLDSHTVTATAENGTVTGADTYEHGTEVTLTATAAEGYEFVNWTVGEETIAENPYKFTVTADVALVANFEKVVPATETVYFINTKKWSAVTAHAWGAKLPDTNWPGLATVKEAEQIAGYDVYSFTANVGDYANVIFNNKGGGSQTPDLVWTAGKYYVIDMGWMTKEEAEAKLAAPLPEVWNVVGEAGLMGKGWDLNAAENAMTKQADGTYKLVKTDITITAGIYEYKAAKDHDWVVAVPQSGNQKLTISTSGVYDVTFVLNVTTKKLTATATLKQAAVVIPSVIIAGSMNSWSQEQDKFTMSPDSLTATFKTTLEVKDYEFKMIVGGAWHSDAKTITRANNSTKFTGANSNTNTTLKADVAGEYLFTWEYATKTLTVTYPALPVKYNVTVTAENGTVTGAGEYEEGATATLTATAAEGYEFVNWTVGEEVVSTENPYSFVVTADVALVANFTPTLPTEIKISGEATHTEYNFGEQFDVTGLVVTAVYSDKEVDITEQVEWTMSPLTIGTTAVEVKATYGTFSATKTCNVTVHVPHNKVTTADVLDGIFLVSDTKAVKFSTGNLQYNCGTYTWSFAEEQYEIIGGEAYDGTNNTNYGMNLPGYTGKLDLFAWSCESSKYGVNPSNTDADYTGAFVDWGTLVEETGWYTLTQAEMQYLLNQKKDGKALWTFASIEGIKGLMLMPYNWDVKLNDDIEYGYAPKDFSAEFEHNVFTADEWNGFQGSGAAFLPTAGSRTGGYGNTENAGVSNKYDENGHYFHVDNVNDYGYYWLNTEDSRDGYQHCASYLIFPGWSDNELKDDESDDFNYGPTIWSREKRRGNSVRLVKETTRPEDAPTDIFNLETGIAPQKIFMNGQLIIIKNGVTYNAQGQVVK